MKYKNFWVTMALFLTLLWIYGLVAIVNDGKNIMDNGRDIIDKKVGKTIVIKSDTLLVMGFNIDTQLYVLDDGREVSGRIIELFELKDE